ncbi:MAG TPA: HD domain-containing protein [Patescibacteria group bacterium]|nr:HD domain-containing protein [Patescibacteria group bacterium]
MKTLQKLDILRQKVEELYASGNPKADVWIDWGYPNHVLVVASLTERIAKAQHANVELAVAGALLHDIADGVRGKSYGYCLWSCSLSDGLLSAFLLAPLRS